MHSLRGGVLIAARSYAFKKSDCVNVACIDHLDIIIVLLELIITFYHMFILYRLHLTF